MFLRGTPPFFVNEAAKILPTPEQQVSSQIHRTGCVREHTGDEGSVKVTAPGRKSQVQKL